MNTHLAINAEAALDSHRHNWQPIDGWRARYRCRDCGVVGRKRGAVKRMPSWEMRDLFEPLEPVAGGAEVTPYGCTLKTGGLRCGCPAVKKTGFRRWRCSVHLSIRPASRKNAARLVMLPPWDDPARAPLHDGDMHSIERSSAA